MLILCQFYVNLCKNHRNKFKIFFFNYVNYVKKKKLFTDRQTDGRTGNSKL